MNMNLHVIFSTNTFMKTKRSFFIDMNIKIKLNLFSNNKLKFNLELFCFVLFCSVGKTYILNESKLCM